MKFIIDNDTDNIEQDVFNTIINFSDERLQQLSKLIDLTSIYNSIYFEYADNDFNFYDETTGERELDGTISNKRFKFLSIEELVALLYSEYNDSNITDKIERIFSALDLRGKFIDKISNDNYDCNFYDMCFKILNDEELFELFLNYDENIELFGQKYTKEDYVFELAKILGNSKDDICNDNEIYNYSIVTQDMLDRYLQLRDIVNIDMRMLGDEPFGEEGCLAYYFEKQKYIDNDWKVNSKLFEYIMNDLDPEYTLEEKIAHIYIKACEALRYNDKYLIYKYETQYDKDRQEAISLENNAVICSEFSRLCTNILSKLDDRLEVRCVCPRGSMHEAVGILITDKNIRVDLEATEADSMFNDLARVKLGLPLRGVHYYYDRNNEFKDAFNRVYNKLLKNRTIETESLISSYEEVCRKREGYVDFEENLDNFLNQMRQRKIAGAELYGSFLHLKHIGYFGEIKHSLVVESENMTLSERNELDFDEEILDGLERNVIINHADNYYLLRMNNPEICKMRKNELNEMFDADKVDYLDDKHSLEGIGSTK